MPTAWSWVSAWCTVAPIWRSRPMRTWRFRVSLLTIRMWVSWRRPMMPMDVSVRALDRVRGLDRSELGGKGLDHAVEGAQAVLEVGDGGGRDGLVPDQAGDLRGEVVPVLAEAGDGRARDALVMQDLGQGRERLVDAWVQAHGRVVQLLVHHVAVGGLGAVDVAEAGYLGRDLAEALLQVVQALFQSLALDLGRAGLPGHADQLDDDAATEQETEDSDGEIPVHGVCTPLLTPKLVEVPEHGAEQRLAGVRPVVDERDHGAPVVELHHEELVAHDGGALHVVVLGALLQAVEQDVEVEEAPGGRLGDPDELAAVVLVAATGGEGFRRVGVGDAGGPRGQGDVVVVEHRARGAAEAVEVATVLDRVLVGPGAVVDAGDPVEAQAGAGDGRAGGGGGGGGPGVAGGRVAEQGHGGVARP